ncbi:hypothetical protein ACHAWX_007603 [Stephanocyclus meneghinianus]
MPCSIAILSVIIRHLIAPTIAAAFLHPALRSINSVTCRQPLNSHPQILASRITRMPLTNSNLVPATSSEHTGDDYKMIPNKDASSTFSVGPAKHVKPTNQHNPSPLAGVPIGPMLASPSRHEFVSNAETTRQPIVVRYMYEGGHIAQGRLCHLFPSSDDESCVITIPQLIYVLVQDGVDIDTFYACAYETSSSDGGWLPLEKGRRWNNPFDDAGNWKHRDSDPGIVFPIAMADGSEGSESIVSSRRIDVKLFRRPRVPSPKVQMANHLPDKNPFSQSNDRTVEHSLDALQCISSSIPSGKIPIQGYFGIGILQPKTSSNIGTLLRSAYQLGASIVYTIGGRYKPNSTDTLNVPARVPLVELNDWNAFVESSPRAAVWVVIEMGGTPLSQFRHPRNAIYILGSEDHGVPKSVLRGCREVVSLEAEEYGSYNVAVAGSIVMYDRMVKMRRGEASEKEEESGWVCGEDHS